MKQFSSAILCVVAFALIGSLQANAACSPILNPNSCVGAQGPQGPQGDTGPAGANGRDLDLDRSLAMSAALSMPAWLETQERFGFSGGLGFTDSDTAIGATGIVRLDKNWSAFAGGAVSTEGSDWAGKAGARVGW